MIVETTMKDVTTRLSSYRECVRHLWNAYFLEAIVHSSDKWTLRDEFDDTCQLLFAALVVEPLGLAAASNSRRLLSPSRDSAPQLLRWLHVVPRETPLGVPIMINRDSTRSDGTGIIQFTESRPPMPTYDSYVGSILTSSAFATFATIWFALAHPHTARLLDARR